MANLDRELPKFAGPVPCGSLVLVGYTVLFYKGRQDVWEQVSNNIAWVIVLGAGDP